MTKYKAKKEDIRTLLNYLDNQINTYYQKLGDYPNLILMNKETKDKIFAELVSGSPIVEECWIDRKNNYRGILLEIGDIDFLKLE